MILDVPYLSQITSPGSDYSINDCGPACVAMLIRQSPRHANVTINEVYQTAGVSSKQPLSVRTVANAAGQYGVQLMRHDASIGVTVADVMQWIQYRRPPIVLVDYAPVMAAKLHESKITGGHFVLVVGYDASSIYVHDPYWRGQGGAYRRWPISVFEDAWYSAKTQYNNVALVPATRLGFNEVEKSPIAEPVKLDPMLQQRIRAYAAFTGSPAPALEKAADIKETMLWLGEFGESHWPYTIKRGDTLSGIAQMAYGNAGLYPVLQVFNNIVNPRLIRVAANVNIPLRTTGEYRFTNGIFLNAVYEAFRMAGHPGDYWGAIEQCGLEAVADDLSATFSVSPFPSFEGIADLRLPNRIRTLLRLERRE